MPKKSSTAKQRARAAARNGAKYTAALRAENAQEPGDVTARATYATISVAKQARAVGASSYVAETMRRQQAMIDSYVSKTIANMVKTSGVFEVLARQEAAMGSMVSKSVANIVAASGIVERLAEQRAAVDSCVTRTVANMVRTSGVFEVLARQEAAMGSMVTRAVANTVAASGIVEKMAEQQAAFHSQVTRTLANLDRTTAVSSRAIAAIEQATVARRQAAEIADALDRATSRLGI